MNETKTETIKRGYYVYLDSEILNILKKEELKDELGNPEEGVGQEIKRLLNAFIEMRSKITKEAYIECP